jgi:hypothetical protein
VATTSAGDPREAARSAPSARGVLRRRAPAVLLLLCIAVGATIWWRDGGKRLFVPRQWDVVVPDFLYRSGQIHARLIEDVLREHRIDLVIDLARDRWSDPDARAEREAIERLGIRRLAFEDLDGSGRGNPTSYVEALAAIAEAQREERRVLVHCTAGSARTGGAVMLYRTLFQGWSGADAYGEYLRYRKRPPRSSRVARFLDAHMPEIAGGLVARQALAALPDRLPVLVPAVSASAAANP